MGNEVKHLELISVSFRLKRGLVEQLRQATERDGKLRLSQTAIVERGIELVLAELNADAVPTRRSHRK